MKKKQKQKLKKFNVFYTPVAYQVEVVVKAATLQEAVENIKYVLGNSVQSVKPGWEIK